MNRNAQYHFFEASVFRFIASYLLHFSFRQYVQHNLCAEAKGVDECLYVGQDVELALGVQKILKELLLLLCH